MIDFSYGRMLVLLTNSTHSSLASALSAFLSFEHSMGNRLGTTNMVNLGASFNSSPAKKTPHRYEFLGKKENQNTVVALIFES